MSIPNWNLLVKNLRKFQEKFLILLPSFFPSFLLSPLPCRFSFEEALVSRLLILHKGLNALSNFANTSEAVPAFYLPLRRLKDGVPCLVPASLFHRLPLHLKEQHGERRNFNRLHKHLAKRELNT